MYLGVLLSLLLLDTAGEAWVMTATGLTWLKAGKNLLYAGIAVATVVRFTRQRRWRELSTPADVAVLFFAATLALSAVMAQLEPKLAVQGAYVYLRGAIVFYAIRALEPDDRWIRRITAGVLAWAGLNAVLALAQIVIGPPAYTVLGWHDLEMAAIHRAQGLYAHPNDLGHLLGLCVVGLFAWLAVRGFHWSRAVMLLLCAAGLAVSQSRESLFATCCGVLVLAVVLRPPWRRVATVMAVLGVLAALPLAILPGARAEVARRAAGLATALGLDVPRPAVDMSLPECGPPPPVHTAKGSPCRRAEPEQEIRILFAKQGFQLLRQRPVTGFGPGTFGGSVALAQDPHWNRHPRFGAQGFDLHGFHGRTVDSFLLHLLVEAGVLGLAAYLAWFWFLGRPQRPVFLGWPRRPVSLGWPRRPVTGSVWVALGPAALVFALVTAVFSHGLEGAPLPPLVFGIVGLAWTQSAWTQSARAEASG